MIADMSDLNQTIAACFAHVERIELDYRMTVREYRDFEAEGVDPRSDEAMETIRMRRLFSGKAMAATA